MNKFKDSLNMNGTSYNLQKTDKAEESYVNKPHIGNRTKFCAIDRMFLAFAVLIRGAGLLENNDLPSSRLKAS